MWTAFRKSKEKEHDAQTKPKSKGFLSDLKASLFPSDSYTPVSKLLNASHTAENPHERERVVEAGGYFADGKLAGLLNETRCIGNPKFKQKYRGLSCIPEVAVFDTRTSATDVYITLACAGVFHGMTVADLGDDLRNRRLNSEDPSMIAEQIARRIVDVNGASEDVSLIVLHFNAAGNIPSAQPVHRSQQVHVPVAMAPAPVTQALPTAVSPPRPIPQQPATARGLTTADLPHEDTDKTSTHTPATYTHTPPNTTTTTTTTTNNNNNNPGHADSMGNSRRKADGRVRYTRRQSTGDSSAKAVAESGGKRLARAQTAGSVGEETKHERDEVYAQVRERSQGVYKPGSPHMYGTASPASIHALVKKNSAGNETSTQRRTSIKTQVVRQKSADAIAGGMDAHTGDDKVVDKRTTSNSEDQLASDTGAPGAEGRPVEKICITSSEGKGNAVRIRKRRSDSAGVKERKIKSMSVSATKSDAQGAVTPSDVRGASVKPAGGATTPRNTAAPNNATPSARNNGSSGTRTPNSAKSSPASSASAARRGRIRQIRDVSEEPEDISLDNLSLNEAIMAAQKEIELLKAGDRGSYSKYPKAEIPQDLVVSDRGPSDVSAARSEPTAEGKVNDDDTLSTHSATSTTKRITTPLTMQAPPLDPEASDKGAHRLSLTNGLESLSLESSPATTIPESPINPPSRRSSGHSTDMDDLDLRGEGAMTLKESLDAEITEQEGDGEVDDMVPRSKTPSLKKRVARGAIATRAATRETKNARDTKDTEHSTAGEADGGKRRARRQRSADAMSDGMRREYNRRASQTGSTDDSGTRNGTDRHRKASQTPPHYRVRRLQSDVGNTGLISGHSPQHNQQASSRSSRHPDRKGIPDAQDQSVGSPRMDKTEASPITHNSSLDSPVTRSQADTPNDHSESDMGYLDSDSNRDTPISARTPHDQGELMEAEMQARPTTPGGTTTPARLAPRSPRQLRITSSRGVSNGTSSSTTTLSKVGSSGSRAGSKVAVMRRVKKVGRGDVVDTSEAETSSVGHDAGSVSADFDWVDDTVSVMGEIPSAASGKQPVVVRTRQQVTVRVGKNRANSGSTNTASSVGAKSPSLLRNSVGSMKAMSSSQTTLNSESMDLESSPRLRRSPRTTRHAHSHKHEEMGSSASTNSSSNNNNNTTTTTTSTESRRRTSSRDTSSRPGSGLSARGSHARDNRRVSSGSVHSAPSTPDITDLELYPELKAAARKITSIKHTPWVEGEECAACAAEKLRKKQRKSKEGNYSRASRERYTSAYRKKAVT